MEEVKTVFLERVTLHGAEHKLRALDKNYSIIYTEMRTEGQVDIYVLKSEKEVYDEFFEKTKVFEKEMREKLKPLLGARAIVTISRKIKI